MNKQAVLWVLLLAGGGYALYAKWDVINEKLGLTELSPQRAKAIKLAQAAYNLDNYRTNAEVVATELRLCTGKIEGALWAAEPRGSQYVVSFRYREDGKPAGYVFQVDFEKIECKLITKIVADDQPGAPR